MTSNKDYIQWQLLLHASGLRKRERNIGGGQRVILKVHMDTSYTGVGEATNASEPPRGVGEGGSDFAHSTIIRLIFKHGTQCEGECGCVQACKDAGW